MSIHYIYIHSIGLPVEVSVQVTNPNPYSLDANRIKAILKVPDAGDAQIATLKHEEGVSIPKEGSETFDLKGNVEYSAAVR